MTLRRPVSRHEAQGEGAPARCPVAPPSRAPRQAACPAPRRSGPRRLWLAGLCGMLLIPGGGAGISPAAGPEAADAWWVWLPGRTEARAAAAGLQPGERVYWHTATLTWSGGVWRDTERPEPPPPVPPPAPASTPALSLDPAPSSGSGPPVPLPASSLPPRSGRTHGAEIVPVLRLQGDGAVEAENTWPPVLERLREMRAKSGADQVQLDCDCPDRLLPLYARRLQGRSLPVSWPATLPAAVFFLCGTGWASPLSSRRRRIIRAGDAGCVRRRMNLKNQGAVPRFGKAVIRLRGMRPQLVA